MSTDASRETAYLPDGSAVRATVRSDDPAVAAIFEADLRRRLRHAEGWLARADAERSLAAYRSFAPGGDGHASTDTHALPGGEVTIAIDAAGRASHGYLRYLGRGAVAYARVLDIEPIRAGLLAAVLLGIGGLVVAVGPSLLAAPFFGAGGVIAAYVALYWLSARGIAISLSRSPRPGGRYP